jgi:hypothetical protein
MYSNISFSPDGKYVMVSHIKKPFSYLVPYNRFPTETIIYDTAGKEISQVNDVPLIGGNAERFYGRAGRQKKFKLEK